MNEVLEILGSIGFDWRVALANLVNFLIVFYLLNRFVLSSVRKTLAERKARIERGIADAEAAEAALVNARSAENEITAEATRKAHESLAEAQVKRQAIIDAAAAEGAHAGAEALKRAEDDIERKRRELERDIEAHAADTVIAGVRSVLAAELDTATNADFITRITASRNR